jgi:hypothetical protein
MLMTENKDSEASKEWSIEEGSGWIPIKGFGEINPRTDNVEGGRQYFTAKLPGKKFARVVHRPSEGQTLSGGPETWQFEFELPFFLMDFEENCVEVTVSPLEGGRYGVRSRHVNSSSGETGGW